MKTRNHLSDDLRKRVLVLDDHPMTRRGLAQLINHEPDLVVCGEAQNAAQALAAIPAARPDLVVADITMPGKSGLEFIKDMKVLHPGIAILVMSMHDETIYAERVMRAGGRGYVMKSEGGEKVLAAIRCVLRGEVYLSPAMAATLLTALTQNRARASQSHVLGSLTDREFEIFQLIGQGLPTSEIGQRLNLSIKTVGTHRVHIKEKLHLRSSTELVKHAVRWSSSEQRP
jgi:DNA-binding NarL/FixJ family response regulator